MAFEQFIPVKKHLNNKDTYSIQAGIKKTGYYSGMIYFNGGMRDKLKLADYEYVELYTDKVAGLIAIKPTNEKSDATRTMRKNGNHRFITCTSWLHTAVKELGYPEKGSGSYTVIDGGLVVLQKPNDSEATNDPK